MRIIAIFGLALLPTFAWAGTGDPAGGRGPDSVRWACEIPTPFAFRAVPSVLINLSDERPW
jgi:hypothetical protein